MAKGNLSYVACFGLAEETAKELTGRHGDFLFFRFSSLEEFYGAAGNDKNFFQAVLVECRPEDDWGTSLKNILVRTGYGHLVFAVIADGVKPNTAKFLLQEGMSEVFAKPLNVGNVMRKLALITESRQPSPLSVPHGYKIPWDKRLFDVVFASLALLLLSPLFLIVSALIRLQSKGPVFYYSLRVGTGYKIFRFYKFRSMAVDADKKLSQLKHLNQYAGGQTGTTAKVKQLCDACALRKSACQSPLYADNEMWCEKLYKDYLLAKGQKAFVKIKDDPRITPIGKFIRNTSIDELPQLWNVIKGDMSLVGNRPLPLYEAEKLTTDKFALRFMAPAGITGLWQVSKRGGGAMSEEERISLDNDYAKSYGLLFDIKLLLRTVPALLQKENV